MIRAWIFDTDLPFLPAGAAASTVPPETRMAGLTLLRRMILMARHEGAEQVTVIARDETARQCWVASEGHHPVAIASVTDAASAPLDEDDQVLLLSTHLLPERGLLRRILGEAREREMPVSAAPEEGGACGPALVPAGWLLPALRAGAAPAEAARQALRSGRLVPLEVNPGAVRHLTSPEAVRAADRSLYEGLTSVADGYIDRTFNRRLSKWFTRAIINLPITPNAVTGLHFSLGLVAAWLFGTGEYWQQALGAVLLQLAVALDCSDGEVARLKYQFSKAGGWLDVWADVLVTIAVFIGVAKSATGILGTSTALTLGALAASGVLMCIVVIYSLAQVQSRRGEAARLAATSRLGSGTAPAAGGNALIDAVMNEATSRDFTVLIVGCALIGRLEWIAWMAGVGSHLFWMVFAAIQLALFRTARTEPR
ncbi:MAG: CDP-alcohol phosphatidyltransferase family protein [Armatimonadota bacterium]